MDFEAGMDNLERMLHDARAEPTDLPLSVLKNITNNFSNDQEVGRGGFAIVYKGRLRNGIVAVKKLHQTLEMQEKKYNQEVALLMRVRHKNIVRFLGYCADTQGKICHHEGEVVMADIRHRLLCFEFLPNGSLDGYITGANQRLEWSTRYKLIKGICEGLNYLHQKNIAHLDLKPANILLDYNMVPKIADFGLSRCFDEGQSQTIASKLVGSQGYLAPEFYDRVITLKLDIYSLGVIIIEILTGKKGHFLIENVLESWSNRLKPSQAGTLLEQVRVCSEIGLECIDRNPEKRPTTKCVTERLREMEVRCSSIETDFVCTSPVTHGDTRFEPGVLSEIGIECTDPNPERRPITPRIVDRLDKIGCTHGFIGSDLRTSSATHEKKVSTESQNPTPKTRSPVLDVHPRALALEDPLEPNKIHGLYLSNTDIEQANVRLSRDAKWQLKDAGAKDRKNVGANDLFDDHNKLITKPTAMPPSGGGGDKKGGKGDNNEVVEVQTKGNGNNGRKRASSAKQNNGASPGMGLIGGWPMSGDSSFPDICQMSGDLNFPDIDQMCGDPMTMGMFMDHLHIGSMQQGGATQGMPAGGRNTPSEQVWAVAMVGQQQQQQQQGMQSGTEVLQVAAAAAGNPRAQQQYMAAAAAGSSMVRPQYIAHGGGDGHVNYGRGKIRGGEQLQNTKQCVAPDSGGGAGGLPVATQGMLAGGRNNIPSGLVRAAVAAGNPMAQQQRGMPSAMEVLQDAAAGGNPRAQQQDMDRMQQQPLLVARGRKNKMH